MGNQKPGIISHDLSWFTDHYFPQDPQFHEWNMTEQGIAVSGGCYLTRGAFRTEGKSTLYRHQKKRLNQIIGC
jgi:hypothetical protein